MEDNERNDTGRPNSNIYALWKIMREIIHVDLTAIFMLYGR